MESKHQYLALARNYWGSGSTKKEALSNMKGQGGPGKDGYVILKLDPPPDNITTCQMQGPMLPDGTKQTVVVDRRAKAQRRRDDEIKRLSKQRLRRYMGTIERGHVGMSLLRFDDTHRADVGDALTVQVTRKVSVADAIGRVQLGDVGKRVYKVGDITQVENDEQRDARIVKGGP